MLKIKENKNMLKLKKYEDELIKTLELDSIYNTDSSKKTISLMDNKDVSILFESSKRLFCPFYDILGAIVLDKHKKQIFLLKGEDCIKEGVYSYLLEYVNVLLDSGEINNYKIGKSICNIKTNQENSIGDYFSFIKIDEFMCERKFSLSVKNHILTAVYMLEYHIDFLERAGREERIREVCNKLLPCHFKYTNNQSKDFIDNLVLSFK